MADKKTAFRTIDGTIIRVHLFHPGIRVKVTTVLTSFSAKQVQVELDPETEAGVYSVLEVAGDSYSTDSFRPATERDYLVKVQPYSARTSDYVADFRNKLHSELMHIEEKPMARLLLHFGESLRNCAQPSVAPNVARQLYEQAAALPGTDTRQQLVEHQHISVNGAWMQRQPHLVTAVDLQSGALLVLKLLPRAEAHLQHAAAAKTRAVQLLRLDDLQADSVLVRTEVFRVKDSPHGTYSALKMPHFATSLERLPQLSEELIVTGARRLQRGKRQMHSASLMHSDLKAANVLLNNAQDWHLADFGSSVKFGQQVWSCTERFYPGQIMHQLAEPKYDWGLLVVLVANELDKANLIGLTGGGNGGVVKDLVLARCAKVKHAGLRDLLSQLIKDAGWV